MRPIGVELLSFVMETPAPKQGDKNWYGEQNADGVDLSLIRENLKLSVDERLRRSDDGYESAVALLRYAQERATAKTRSLRVNPPQTRG